MALVVLVLVVLVGVVVLVVVAAAEAVVVAVIIVVVVAYQPVQLIFGLFGSPSKPVRLLLLFRLKPPWTTGQKLSVLPESEA